MDIDSYAQKYSRSQYIHGDAAIETISDSELYVFAGYAYVNGEDPTQINFEHPPLGKYLFGLSYLLTGNSFLINIPLFFLILWMIYLLTGRILKSNLLRILVVVIFGTMQLFTAMIANALLDIPFLLSLLSFFLTLSWSTNKKVGKYLLAGVFLGLIVSIKYPFPFIFIPTGILFMNAYLQKELKYALISLVVAGGIYLGQYASYFAHNHSIIDWIEFEKYRFGWWTGDRTAPKFLIFETIFTGKHRAWWSPGTYSYSPDWTPLIPLIFVLALIAIKWIKRLLESDFLGFFDDDISTICSGCSIRSQIHTHSNSALDNGYFSAVENKIQTKN